MDTFNKGIFASQEHVHTQLQSLQSLPLRFYTGFKRISMLPHTLQLLIHPCHDSIIHCTFFPCTKESGNSKKNPTRSNSSHSLPEGFDNFFTTPQKLVLPPTSQLVNHTSPPKRHTHTFTAPQQEEVLFLPLNEKRKENELVHPKKTVPKPEMSTPHPEKIQRHTQTHAMGNKTERSKMESEYSQSKKKPPPRAQSDCPGATDKGTYFSIRTPEPMEQ